MSGLSSYSGITTKIRAIRSRMLSHEQLRELAECKDVAQVIHYLVGTKEYGTLMASVSPEELHRGNIEKILKNCYYRDFEKLYHFADMEQRKYLMLYFKRFELSFMKACLRNICRTNSEDRSDRDIVEVFKRHSKLDAQALQAETTIEGFVEKLRGTEYYLPMKHVVDAERHTLFDYEAALDYCYFTSIWKDKQKNFKGLDAKILDRSLGYKLDILNMQWIYRSKRYYNLSNTEIYAILLPMRSKLTKNDLTRMVEAKDIKEFAVALQRTYYGKLYPQIAGENLEDIYIYLLDKVHETDGFKYPYSVAIINSYLYQKEYEINKITTIMESIRYRLPYEEIVKYARIN